MRAKKALDLGPDLLRQCKRGALDQFFPGVFKVLVSAAV